MELSVVLDDVILNFQNFSLEAICDKNFPCHHLLCLFANLILSYFFLCLLSDRKGRETENGEQEEAAAAKNFHLESKRDSVDDEDDAQKTLS